MSREQNVEDIISDIVHSDENDHTALIRSLARRFIIRGNPTDEYIDFLWNIVQQLESYDADQRNRIRSFLMVCETGDAGTPITGIIDKKRFRAFSRIYNDYSKIVERIFQNNDDTLQRIFGNEPYTLSNSAIVFMIQKMEETPICPYGNRCYRKNPQHFINFKHSGGTKQRKTRKQRKSNRNHTKIRKRHRNL